MSATVRIDDEIAARLAAEAERQGLSPDELAARVLGESLPGVRTLGFTGLGHSGREDLSTELKDLRRAAFAERLTEG